MGCSPSHANHHYQKRFDRLAELAAAGEWDAVAGYECTGINSYAKMVRQYRDRLVAEHKAQSANRHGSDEVFGGYFCSAITVVLYWRVSPIAYNW